MHKKTRLTNIADIKTGFPLRRAAKHDPAGNANLVQMKDVDSLNGVDWDQTIKIDTKKHRSANWLENEDILFVGRGSRFFAVRVKNAKDNSVASPHFYVLRCDVKKVLPEFLVWFLNSKKAHKFYASNQEGSSLPYLSRKTLVNLPILLPNIKTQKKIVDTYKNWKHQRRLLEELTEKKDIYINALLEQTLEGETT